MMLLHKQLGKLRMTFIIYYGSRPFDQNVCLFVAFYSSYIMCL